MNNFILNLKKYYVLLLNAIIPFLIFFLPVYGVNYIDELETIEFSYNFYNLFNINIDKLFFILILLSTIFCLFNLILFIVFCSNHYKLIFYKKNLNRTAIILCLIFTLISLTILICAIIIGSRCGGEILKYDYNLGVGSVIYFIYCVIQLIIISFKHKRKQL